MRKVFHYKQNFQETPAHFAAERDLGKTHSGPPWFWLDGWGSGVKFYWYGEF